MESNFEDAGWERPSDAEMKIIAARRERSDQISKLMGTYLLKGYKMLDTVCRECQTILLQDRQGVNYCVACTELNSDTNKDDPATNPTAALRQVREVQMQNSNGDTTHHVTAAIMHDSSVTNSVSTATGSSIPSMLGTNSERIETAEEALSPPESNDFTFTSKSLSEKVTWATLELNKTVNIDYAIKLCSFISHAVEALKAIKC